MNCKTLVVIGLFFLLLTGLPVIGDVTLKGVQHQDAMMGKPAKDLETTQYYSDDFVRIVNDESDQLFKFETGELISVDHKTKEYMIIDFSKMQALFEQMKPMMGDMKVTVEPTGEAKEILGKKCSEYLVKMESKMMSMEQQNWISTDVNMNMEKFQEFFEKQLKLTGIFENAEEFMKMKGLTLQQEMKISVMGMEMIHSFTPKEILEDDIAVPVFNIPKDYKGIEFEPGKLQQ